MEEFFAEGVFVRLLGLFCPFAGVFLGLVGSLPGVDVGDGVVGYGSQRFLLANCFDLGFHGLFICGLHLVQFRSFNGHNRA